MCRTRTPSLLIPPLLDTSLFSHQHLFSHFTRDGEEGRNLTYLMELAPANQPSHLIPRLKVLETNRTFRHPPLLIHTILLRRHIRKHAPSSMTHSILQVTSPFAAIVMMIIIEIRTRTTHTTRPLSGQTLAILRLRSIQRGCGTRRSRMQSNTFLDVLRPLCIVAVWALWW